MEKDGVLDKKEHEKKIERLDLNKIYQSLQTVKDNWIEIDQELISKGIGKRDIPFNDLIMDNMMSGYSFLDSLLANKITPFTIESRSNLIQLNNRVHYGDNNQLLADYTNAIEKNIDQFNTQIETIENWYNKHRKLKDDPLKIAAEIYISILGHPQLYNEGNHRTGNLILDWICAYHGLPIFVLSADNAIAYFLPSSEIKKLDKRSLWRSPTKLPKYRNAFLRFLEEHLTEKFILKTI